MQIQRNKLRGSMLKRFVATGLAAVMAFAGIGSVSLGTVHAEEEFTADGGVSDWKDIVDILEEPEGAFDRVAAYCDEENFYILFSVNELSKWCYFQVFLDTDKNSSTGFDTDGGGYEYLMENGNIYMSEAGEWPDTEVGEAEYGISDDGSVLEVKVPFEIVNPTSDVIPFQIVLLNDSWESVYKFPEEGSMLADLKENVTIVSDEPYISDFNLEQEEVLALTEPAMQGGTIAAFSAKGGDGTDYTYSFVASEKNGPDNKNFLIDGDKLITDKKLLAPGFYRVNVKAKSGVRSEIKSFVVTVGDPAPGSITDDIFTGDMGEWFVVDHAEATDESEENALVAAISQNRFYVMISTANKDFDTRSSFVLDTGSAGYEYLGCKGADYVIHQQKLYPVIGDGKLGAPITTVDEDYYEDYTTASVYLDDMGDPDKVSVHAFAKNREVSVPESGYLDVTDAFEMTYEDGFVYPKAGYDAFTNPGMGWACWTTISNEDAENIGYDYDLAYLPLTWANLETSKGEFDWDNVEKEYHISYWEDNDVNFIIRFVIDTPELLSGSRKDETYGEVVDKEFIESNSLSEDDKVTVEAVEKLVNTGNYRMDIPTWLFAELCNDVLAGKIKDAGTFYNWPDFDVLGGGGFSPNYESESMISYHDACMKAIAGKFDGSAAYIEMGSLGHWGEMHTWPEAASFDDYDFGSGVFPGKSTIEKYAKSYTDYFKKTKIGIREAYDFSIQQNFGLFNDVFGQEEGTMTFLGDIAKSPDFWKNNYSGGEFASGDVTAWVNNDMIMRTISYLRDSHTSWLGPCSPCDLADGSVEAGKYRANIEYLQTKMGYRYRVSKVKVPEKINKGGQNEYTLTFVNEGLAPSYNDYAVKVSVMKDDLTELGSAVKDVEFSKLLPGESLDVTVPVKISADADGKCYVVVSVVDKNDKEPCMNLGMADKFTDHVTVDSEEEPDDRQYVLYTFEADK